jgi:hypothetical protein
VTRANPFGGDRTVWLLDPSGRAWTLASHVGEAPAEGGHGAVEPDRFAEANRVVVAPPKPALQPTRGGSR